MVANVIIIVAVALVFGLCLKKLISEMKKGDCSGCGGCCSSCRHQCTASVEAAIQKAMKNGSSNAASKKR